MESRIIAYKQEPKKQTLFAISSFNIDIRKIIISIFFEYEMDFSFINTITGLKKMEDLVTEDFR